MAKTSQIIRVRRQKRKYLLALSQGRTLKFATRVYNRCERCGRSHGYIRYFEMCRICIRELAREGLIAGLRKSSW